MAIAGRVVWVLHLARGLCCALRQNSLLSQCLSPPRSMKGDWGISKEA